MLRESKKSRIEQEREFSKFKIPRTRKSRISRPLNFRESRIPRSRKLSVEREIFENENFHQSSKHHNYQIWMLNSKHKQLINWINHVSFFLFLKKHQLWQIFEKVAEFLPKRILAENLARIQIEIRERQEILVLGNKAVEREFFENENSRPHH